MTDTLKNKPSDKIEGGNSSDKPKSGETEPTTKLEPNEPGKAEAPITRTQAEIDAIVEGRVAETKTATRQEIEKKYGDLESLKTKAAAYDTAKDADMTEQEKIARDLQTANDRIAALESLETEVESLRAFVDSIVEVGLKDQDDATKSLLSALDNPLKVAQWLKEHGDTNKNRKQIAPDTHGNRTTVTTPEPIIISKMRL